MRARLHHLVAHPLLVLAPGLGGPLHDATIPTEDRSNPALDIGVGLVLVALLAVPGLLAAVVLALVIRRVAELGR